MKKFVIFIFIILCLLPKMTKASMVNLVSNRFDNMYTYYYDREQDRTRYLEASKYSFNGRVAYCLEIGTYISSMAYNYFDNFDKINISADDLDYIKIISYYGYDYPGHQTDNFYLATQDLIWRRLIRTNIKFTYGFNPDSFVNLSKEEEEIYSLFRKHNTKPSFDGTTTDYLLGDKIVITDNNNVLSMYNTTQDGVSIDGNNLIIDSNFRGNKIILNRPIYNTNSFLLYTSGNSQKMMSTGEITMPNSKLKVNVISGSISISKLDYDSRDKVPKGEATLNGAIYGLYDKDNNLIDKFIIGQKEKIDNLAIGNYYVKEILPSKGYNLDNNIYDVLITDNNLEVHLDVYEKVMERKIEVFKVFASDSTGIMTSEEGIIFNIYDNKNVLVYSITTDSDGYASVTLPYGTYNFKQINTTPGFYKTDDFMVTVDDNDDRPIYKLISDSMVKAKVKVIKKDDETNDNILNSNIKFRIFDVKNNDFVSFDITYPSVNSISVFSLNNDGTLVTPDYLPYGEYILYEVDERMDGYLYNPDGVKFTIDDNTNFINDNDDIVLEVPFYNKRVKGKIIINKYGEDIIYKDDMYYYKEIFLNDAVFELYAKEDIYENSLLVYKKDVLVGECTSDDGGVCLFDNLPLGEYYIKEVKSSNNNEIDDNIYDVKLEYKDQYTKEIIYEKDIFNYLKKGTLIINKYDSKDNTKIANTLIEIRDDSDRVIYNGYTNNDGQIIIDDLLYGNYYLSEVEASSGYRLLEDDIHFVLDKKSVSIDVYNDKEEVPNTGVDIGIINMFIVVILLLSFIFIYIFWLNKRIRFLFIFINLISLLYLGNYFYSYFSDNKKNTMAINDFFNNSIDFNYDEKYKYTSVIEIPSIDLKRGIVNMDNKYNDVKYNIELIRKKENSIVLAAHNGNYNNSYFDNLKDMELSDHINYYDDNKLYDYVFSERYVIKKDGTASIYCPNDKKCIHLVTCLEGNDGAQIIYVGYLNDIRNVE